MHNEGWLWIHSIECGVDKCFKVLCWFRKLSTTPFAGLIHHNQCLITVTITITKSHFLTTRLSQFWRSVVWQSNHSQSKYQLFICCLKQQESTVCVSLSDTEWLTSGHDKTGYGLRIADVLAARQASLDNTQYTRTETKTGYGAQPAALPQLCSSTCYLSCTR